MPGGNVLSALLRRDAMSRIRWIVRKGVLPDNWLGFRPCEYARLERVLTAWMVCCLFSQHRPKRPVDADARSGP